MTATHGRGNYHRAVNSWLREDATDMHYLPGAWAWVCVVPESMDRPDWIPVDAIAHELSHHETAYTWGRA